MGTKLRRLRLERCVLNIIKIISEKLFYKVSKSNNEILMGTLSGFILKLVAFVLNYLLAIYITNIYSTKSFGVFTLVFTLLNLLTIFSMVGTGNGSIRFIANLNRNGDVLGIKNVIKKIFLIGALGTLLITIFLFIFMNQLANLLFDGNTFPVQIVLISLPLYVFMRYGTFIYRGLKKVIVSLLYESVLLRGVILFILLSGLYIDRLQSKNLPIFAIFISTIIISLFCIYNLYKDKLFLNSGKSSKGISLKEILITSSPMMISSSIQMLLFWVDTLMIGIFLSSSDVGIYNVAVKISVFTSFFLVSINNIITPKISELYWKNDSLNLKRNIIFSSKLSLISSSPILIVILFFPEFFLGIFGEEFIAAKYCLIILCISQFVNSLTGFNYQILNMTGEQKTVRNILSIALIVNVILNIILISKYEIIGAAIATSISLIFKDITLTIFANKKLGFKTFYTPKS